MIRVLLADDHPLLLDGLVHNLADSEIRVVCETRVSCDILGLYRLHRPDAVITDIMFGERKKSGLDILSELIAEDSEARVIIFSQYDSVELIKDAYSRGAKAYIPKSLEVNFVNVIQSVASGNKYFDPTIATKLAEYAVQGRGQLRSPNLLLKGNELKLFKLLAQGYTQKEAARILNLSLRSVTSLFAVIREKLDVERPADMTILAIQHNLIDINGTPRRRLD